MTTARLRRGRRTATAVAATACLLLAVTACGSSNDKSSSQGATQDPDVTFTGAPVTVMTMAPYDNDVLDAKVMLTIAQGAVVSINNNGGINGHELKLITCNEGADANKAAACARQAVSSKVAALVGGFTTNGDTVMPILEAAGIPWVGPPGVSASELSSKDSFPVMSGVLGLAGLGRKAAQDGCTKVAAVNFDLPSSTEIAQLVDVGLASVGHAKSTLIKVPPTTADFSTIAQEVKDYDCAIVGTPPQAMVGIAAAGASLGSKTKLYIIGGGLTSTETDKLGAAINGAVSYTSFPVGDDSIWNDAKQQVGDLKDDASGGWSGMFQQNTWVAYQAFANTLGNSTDLTPAGITATLDKTTDLDTGGFTPPINFTQDFPAPGLNRVFNHQVIFTQVDDGKIKPEGNYVDLIQSLVPGS